MNEAKGQTVSPLASRLASSSNHGTEIHMVGNGLVDSQPLARVEGADQRVDGLPRFPSLARPPLHAPLSLSRGHKELDKAEEQTHTLLFPLLAALPVALSKGFCASLTTFSSWILALLHALCDDPDLTPAALPPSPYTRANRLIWAAIFGISAPMFAFRLGTDAGVLLQRLVLRKRPRLWTFSDTLRASREAPAEAKHRRRRGAKCELEWRGSRRHERKGSAESQMFCPEQRRVQDGEEGHEPRRNESAGDQGLRLDTPDSRGNSGAFGNEVFEESPRDKGNDVRREQAPSACGPVPTSVLMRDARTGVDKPANGTGTARFRPGAFRVEGQSPGNAYSVHSQKAEEKGSPCEGAEFVGVASTVSLRDGKEHGRGCECGGRPQKKGHEGRGRILETRTTGWAQRAWDCFAGSSAGERKATFVAALLAAAVYALFGCLARYDTDATRKSILWYPPLLSFVGAWLRYTLSAQLDVYTPYFPMGTFLSNVLASVLVGCVEILLHREYRECRRSTRLQPAKCTDTPYFLIEAAAYGICSSLSTMSTFIAELSILPTRYAYRYGLLTVLFAFGCAILVYAPLR